MSHGTNNVSQFWNETSRGLLDQQPSTFDHQFCQFNDDSQNTNRCVLWSPAVAKILKKREVDTQWPSVDSMMTISNGNIFRVTGPWLPVDSSHKGQWRGILTFCMIFARTNNWASIRDAGDLRSSLWRHCNSLVVNIISDRQYKNKDKLLTKQNTVLLIAVRGHQRSPWAHRAGGLKVHMFIGQPRAEQVKLDIMRHNGQ